MRFLGSIHRIEQAVEHAARDHGGERPGDDSSVESLLHDLWLAQHELDLVAVSEPLRGATYRYAHGEAAAARRELPEAQDQGRVPQRGANPVHGRRPQGPVAGGFAGLESGSVSHYDEGSPNTSAATASRRNPFARPNCEE